MELQEDLILATLQEILTIRFQLQQPTEDKS